MAELGSLWVSFFPTPCISRWPTQYCLANTSLLQHLRQHNDLWTTEWCVSPRSPPPQWFVDHYVAQRSIWLIHTSLSPLGLVCKFIGSSQLSDLLASGKWGWSGGWGWGNLTWSSRGVIVTGDGHLMSVIISLNLSLQYTRCQWCNGRTMSINVRSMFIARSYTLRTH